MGGIFSVHRELKVMFVGAVGTGKSTLVHQLNGAPNPDITQSFVETDVVLGNCTFHCRDVQANFFDMWLNNPSNTAINPWFQEFNETSIVFVMDGSQPDRYPQARASLRQVLSCEELRDTDVIIAANKMDLPSAASPQAVANALGLPSFRARRWFFMPISAVDPAGSNHVLERLFKMRHVRYDPEDDQRGVHNTAPQRGALPDSDYDSEP